MKSLGNEIASIRLPVISDVGIITERGVGTGVHQICSRAVRTPVRRAANMLHPILYSDLLEKEG